MDLSLELIESERGGCCPVVFSFFFLDLFFLFFLLFSFSFTYFVFHLSLFLKKKTFFLLIFLSKQNFISCFSLFSFTIYFYLSNISLISSLFCSPFFFCKNLPQFLSSYYLVILVNILYFIPYSLSSYHFKIAWGRGLQCSHWFSILSSIIVFKMVLSILIKSHYRM